jgi:hypothetical protein
MLLDVLSIISISSMTTTKQEQLKTMMLNESGND